ncbi:Bacterial transcription activator, effector binding domain [compost metagenome]
MTEQLLDLPELNVIGWTNVNASGEPYANVWEFVFGEFDIDAKFDSIPSKVQDSGCYLGLFQNRTSVPKLWEQATWDQDFFLAVVVKQFDFIPEGLVQKTFPASTYAIFTANGVPHSAFQNTWNHIHNEWLPHSEYKFNSDSVFFIQYTENSGPDDERFEALLYVPIVKK